ncbi:hypothetical protein [Aquabacterium sp.]|uniref:hypothetical protein n=1 Tax=Aquabacterium sp. TaxID=1872578 RepID=UPI003D6D7997
MQADFRRSSVVTFRLVSTNSRAVALNSLTAAKAPEAEPPSNCDMTMHNTKQVSST